MNDDKQPLNDNMQPDKSTPSYTGKTYAYIAIGLSVLAAILIGLTFTPLGVYSLISSIISSIASLAFLNIQTKKNNFKNLVIFRIAAYSVLAVAVAFFAGGLIWSAVKG